MVLAKPCATASNALSQLALTIAPLSRSIGFKSRVLKPKVSPSAEPFEHSRPKFAG